MAERMTDERLAELLAIQDALGDMLSPEELELGQAMKAERQEVEKLSNGYACPVCGGYPGPEDNCACGGSGHIEDAYDYLRKDHIRLEQEVERLEGVIAAGHDPALLHDLELANKEVERLRSAVGHGTGKAIAAQITAEARLAELVGRLRAELDACDVEEMAYCGGGDGPCGGPAQQPDTVERVRAVLKEYSDE